MFQPSLGISLPGKMRRNHATSILLVGSDHPPSFNWWISNKNRQPDFFRDSEPLRWGVVCGYGASDSREAGLRRCWRFSLHRFSKLKVKQACRTLEMLSCGILLGKWVIRTKRWGIYKNMSISEWLSWPPQKIWSCVDTWRKTPS